MVLEGIRKLLDRLSVRAVFNRLDRRKLQNELDVHKLYLLTSHHLKVLKGEQLGDKYVHKLTTQAAELGHEGMQAAVAAALHQQLVTISAATHDCLLEAQDPMQAAQHAMLADLRQQQHAAAKASPKASRPRGLAAAMGAVDHRQQPTASRIMPSGVLDATPHGEGTSAPLAVDRSDNSSSVPGPHTPLPAVDMSDKRDKVPAAGVLAPTDAKSDQGDSAAELDTPAPAGEDSSGLLGDNDVVDRASSSSSSESGSSSDSDDSSSSAVSTEPASTDSGTKDSSTDTANAQPATAQPAEVQPSEPDPAAMQSSVISRQSQQLSRHSIHSAPLNLANLSEAVKEKLGYSLHVAPSGISHADAGQGLWLEGRAPVGAVVALYPGLVYSPMHYRRIPGFPKIDAQNDYFLARFDGALIDGHAWTRVAAQTGSMQSTGHQESAVQKAWMAQLQKLETRHPLAQAHFANHPPAGAQPNVMVAAYDFAVQPGEEPWLRVYMPNVMYQEQTQQETQDPAQQPVKATAIKGIAFVATRELQDEELLLNYRLNPQVQKPEWYIPVDIEEDKRRWY